MSNIVPTQYSLELAELLSGSYDLRELSHESKIHRIYSLIALQRAMMDVGELEHTNDWDWRVTVIDVNDKSYGTVDFPDDPDYERSTWADTIELPYTIESDDYLDGFARWTTIRVETFRASDPDPMMIDVPVDSIATITIGEA